MSDPQIGFWLIIPSKQEEAVEDTEELFYGFSSDEIPRPIIIKVTFLGAELLHKRLRLSVFLSFYPVCFFFFSNFTVNTDIEQLFCFCFVDFFMYLRTKTIFSSFFLHCFYKYFLMFYYNLCPLLYYPLTRIVLVSPLNYILFTSWGHERNWIKSTIHC